MATEEKKNPPVHTIKVGSVKADIWLQEPDGKDPFYTVTFSRSYKKGEEWKTSRSFSLKQLEYLTDASIDAKDWIANNPLSEQKAAA